MNSPFLADILIMLPEFDWLIKEGWNFTASFEFELFEKYDLIKVK